MTTIQIDLTLLFNSAAKYREHQGRAFFKDMGARTAQTRKERSITPKND